MRDETRRDETVCGPCGICCVACVHMYMIFTCFLHVMVVVPLTFHNASFFFASRCSFKPVSHVDRHVVEGQRPFL